ncbi:histidine--tRNA ligase [Brackiella oedipodis]|uniref:histidine--tRNA ligase n=1 Tax=Brackiella oedipodis TaxID=124225 RepID=UPI0004900439|nr:histidine--tRNA ligase [Brackiella oedipodis]
MSKTFQKLKAIRGMNDILPAESFKWQQLEAQITQLLSLYGYSNIRTPILESTRLFARGIGEVTDIVEKEMYTFSMSPDKQNIDDMLTMRPEFTAGIVRAAIEHNITYDRPQRLYTMGPVFRHERPQKGRYRQFHQLSVEALGFSGADTDAELIIMLKRLWQQLGLEDIRLELNSLGQPEERLAHRAALIAYFEQHKEQLDEDAQRRLYSNPLRILDTKNPNMQTLANQAPKLFDFLGQASKAHFAEVCRRLEQAGISYTLNPRLVRGLDYYNLTVFEWVTDRLGAQGTVCGGGRYDGLCELLGGKATPAAGFGLGLERLLALLEQKESEQLNSECDVYFVHQGQAASELAAQLAEQCRDQGVRAIVHAGTSSFKSQFKRADQSGAQWAAILGESEVNEGSISLKPLRADKNGNISSQLSVPQAQLVTTLTEHLA